MHERPSEGSRSGYVVVLIGAVGFVVSCFLPYTDFDLPGMVTPSFYRLIVRTGGTATLERIGGSLYLFAGATIVAVIAIAGIARPRRWTPYALAAASAAWSLAWIGALLNTSGLISPKRAGYWGLFVGIGVVVLGTIVALVSARVGVREPSSAAT